MLCTSLWFKFLERCATDAKDCALMASFDWSVPAFDAVTEHDRVYWVLRKCAFSAQPRLAPTSLTCLATCAKILTAVRQMQISYCRLRNYFTRQCSSSCRVWCKQPACRAHVLIMPFAFVQNDLCNNVGKMNAKNPELRTGVQAVSMRELFRFDESVVKRKPQSASTSASNVTWKWLLCDLLLQGLLSSWLGRQSAPWQCLCWEPPFCILHSQSPVRLVGDCAWVC